jgi:hypothetical protein
MMVKSPDRALSGDTILFAREDHVEEARRIADPVVGSGASEKCVAGPAESSGCETGCCGFVVAREARRKFLFAVSARRASSLMLRACCWLTLVLDPIQRVFNKERHDENPIDRAFNQNRSDA